MRIKWRSGCVSRRRCLGGMVFEGEIRWGIELAPCLKTAKSTSNANSLCAVSRGNEPPVI